MLLGLNKEDVKNARKVEAKSILRIKMSFSEVYSWSYSHSTLGTMVKWFQSSARWQWEENSWIWSHKKSCKQREPEVLTQEWDPVQQGLLWTLKPSWSPLFSTPNPTSALISSNWQGQCPHSHTCNGTSAIPGKGFFQQKMFTHFKTKNGSTRVLILLIFCLWYH